MVINGCIYYNAMQEETAETLDYCRSCKSLWAYRQAHNLKVVGSNPTPATK